MDWEKSVINRSFQILYPEPVTEKDRMDMDIDMIVEIKEVEIVDAAHCETMEEIARLKRKMTSRIGG